MKAAVLTPGGFELKNETIPVCGPGQVLVRTAGCGVCEGDVFQYANRMARQGQAEDFIRLGHEGSGVVAEVGSQVTEFKEGDRVTSLYGDYAEYFLAERTHLTRLPAGIEVKMALGEPLACCMSAARRFGIRMGDRVALVGCGYMGLSCLQLARLQGAAEVVAFDLLDWRLETARKMGADRVMNSAGALPDIGEFDVAIEATGAAPAIDFCVKLLRHHGTMNLVGYHQSNGGVRQIDMKTWNYKALTVVNGHVRDEIEKLSAMQAALNLAAHGKLDSTVLVTNYAFADINRAFRELTARKIGLYKANLVF